MQPTQTPTRIRITLNTKTRKHRVPQATWRSRRPRRSCPISIRVRSSSMCYPMQAAFSLIVPSRTTMVSGRRSFSCSWSSVTSYDPPNGGGGVFPSMLTAHSFSLLSSSRSCASCHTLVPQRHAHHQRWSGHPRAIYLQPGQAVYADSARSKCDWV